MNRGYIRSLDGIRALAIVLVMSFHANLNHFGWMGVQLFFVLSGYLITGILWNEKDLGGSQGFKLKRFWARRSLRIFPLYFGFLVLLAVVYLVTSAPHHYPRYLPYLATYTFNYTRTFADWQTNPSFTHFWSLSIEEQFYLFFALFIFFTPKRVSKYLMVGIIVLSPFTRYFLFRQFSGHGDATAADAVYWHTLSHLDAFFIGGSIPAFALDKKIRKPQLLLAVAFLVAIAAGLLNFLSSSEKSYPWTMGYGHAQTLNGAYVWQYTLLNLLFGSLILHLVSIHSKENFATKIFERNWMVSIGRVSYGMYIFHWAVLVYIFRRIAPGEEPILKFCIFPLYVLVVYLMARLSYRFYESRFLRLKNKLRPPESEQ